MMEELRIYWADRSGELGEEILDPANSLPHDPVIFLSVKWKSRAEIPSDLRRESTLSERLGIQGAQSQKYPGQIGMTPAFANHMTRVKMKYH